MEKELNGDILNIPQHIAIILDGNGRWAKKRGMPRNYGHMQGAKNVEQICQDAYDLGVRNCFTQEEESQSDSFIPNFKGDTII